MQIFFFPEISAGFWNNIGTDTQKFIFYMWYIHTYKPYICCPFWKSWIFILRKSLASWENFRNILQGMFELIFFFPLVIMNTKLAQPNNLSWFKKKGKIQP